MSQLPCILSAVGQSRCILLYYVSCRTKPLYLGVHVTVALYSVSCRAKPLYLAVHVTVALYSVSSRTKPLYLAVHVTLALYSVSCRTKPLYLAVLCQLQDKAAVSCCTLSAIGQSLCILLYTSQLPCTLSAVGQSHCILVYMSQLPCTLSAVGIFVANTFYKLSDSFVFYGAGDQWYTFFLSFAYAFRTQSAVRVFRTHLI
jgi:hypothetical protein